MVPGHSLMINVSAGLSADQELDDHGEHLGKIPLWNRSL